VRQHRYCFAMVLATAFLVLTASGSNARSASDARACLSRIVTKPVRIGGEALRRLVSDVVATCFGKPGSQELWNQAGALPFTVAIHAGTGKEVHLRYFCSDVCPEYGSVSATLANISEAECCAIGAIPSRDPAWGAYRGCRPAELASDYEKSRARCGKPELMDQ
jgi:hypothetical protein